MIFGTTELAILIIPLLILYLIPSIIAFSRNSPNKIGVLILNLFLGFTVIGWLIALIWSFSSNSKTTIIVNNSQHDNKTEKPNHQQNNFTDDLTKKLNHIERLKKLYDDGAISKEEFENQKERILNS